MKKQLIMNSCLAGIIILLVVLFICEGLFISEIPPSSWIFPGFIFGIVTLLGIAEIAHNIFLARKETKTKAVDPGTDSAQAEDTPLFTNKKNILVISALMILYVLIFYLFGFLTASIIFAVLYGIYSKYPKKLLFFSVTILIIVALFIIFSKFLGVSFSPGMVWKTIRTLVSR
jgi:hypothetical protein